MPLQRLDSLSDIAAHTWDALMPQAQPFMQHGFLSALEDSASIGPHSGWQTEHLLHWEGDRLMAAFDALNAAIREEPPLSWYPGEEAVILPPDLLEPSK